MKFSWDGYLESMLSSYQESDDTDPTSNAAMNDVSACPKTGS